MTTLQPPPGSPDFENGDFENHPKALELDHLVRQTRTRLRLRALLTGLGWVLCFPLAILLVAACIDMFAPFPVPLRIITFYSLLFMPLLLALFTIIRPAFERMPLQKVALRIEAFIPGMHNRLVTVLDLIHGTANSTIVQAIAGDGFAERLLEQTRAKLANFNINLVANLKPVYRAAIAFAAVLLTFIVTALIFHDRMPTAIARLLQPTADIAPVAAVKLDADPGDVSVLQGDPVLITAKVLRGQPDDLSLRLQSRLPSGAYTWITYPLTKDAAGNFAFTLTSLDADAGYQIMGGGTWSPRHQITMIRRPAIEHIDMSVQLPNYTRLYDARPVADDAAQVSALQGSNLHISATVNGSAKRGEVQFLKAVHTITSESREQEILWFDNDFPSDAKLIGKPRWTSDQAPTPGARTHTFSWAKDAYGFSSRVTRLEVRPSVAAPPAPAPGAPAPPNTGTQTSFFLAAYLDPTDAPSRISIALTDAANVIHVFTWGTDADKPVPGLLGKPLDMGPLPKPGTWTRLEIPYAKLTNTNQPIIFAGILFNTDHGRVWFSRAGAIERRAETITRTTYEKAGVVKMTPDPAAATQPASLDRAVAWNATIPVDTDGLFSLAFFTEKDHPSLPMKPIELIATTDQMPTLVVERPGGNITVNDWAAVPVLIRAFDDYGVQSVSIQVGTDPAKLGEPIELATYKKMGLNQVVLGSIDVGNVLAGKTGVVVYKVLVADSKGQSTYSDLYRINVAAPNASAAALVNKSVVINAPILEGLNKLLAVQVKVSDATAKLLSNLPPPPAPATQPDKEAAQEKTYIASLTPEQQANFSEVVKLLAERQAMAEVLQKQYDEAAKQAKNSPTALPVEAAALNAMADNLRQMSMDKNDQLKANADTLSKLQAMQQRTPEQEQQMKDLQRQMGALQEAHDELAKNPQQAQETLSALNTELTADRVGDQLDKVKTDAEQQADALDALRKQVDDMKDQIATATPERLNELAKEQQQLDAVANALVERQNAVLSDPANPQKDPAVVPPQPWVPPTRNADEDKPKEKDQAPKPADAPTPAANAAAPLAKAPEDNPWDKPAAMPALPAGPKDPNAADDPAKPLSNQAQAQAQPDAPKPNMIAPDQAQPTQQGHDTPATPRQQFAAHAEAVDKTLQQAQKNIADAQAKAGEASKNLDNALDKFRLKGLDNPDAKDPNATSAATAALQQVINSSSMRWALNTANRQQQLPSVAAVITNAKAQAENTEQEIKPNMGQSGVSSGAMPKKADEKFLNIVLTGDGPGGPSAAGVYRLPPAMRQPILQGMQEKGPDGYQPIIDAYYRLISKDQTP